jgi:hypothetical protein
MRCCECDGQGYATAHVCGLRDGRRFGEWRRLRCSYCGGTGEMSEAQADAYRQGEALRADRLRRGMKLHEEARRLGISANELSRRERGRLEAANAG